jgi:uncharacterized protein (TIGR01370 family)
MAGRRVLLFGASGFLGSQVGDALDHDPRVGTVIRVGRQRADRPGTRWISHDLIAADADKLAALVRSVRPDAVINCAGRLSGDVVQLVEANVLVTARMIEAVAREAPAARLVMLGSAAEYGPTPYGEPVGEDHAASPIAAYGVTRLASTQLVRLAVSGQRLDAAVLRVFSPIGPGVPPENLLGRAAASIRVALSSGEDTVVLGPLGAYRDFVDIRDVATAVTAAALADQVKEPVLNVGSGRPVQCREVVNLLAEIAGFTGQVVETDPPSERSGSVDWSVADLSRIERSLGWITSYTLRASVEASWHGGELGPHGRAGLTGSAKTGSGSLPMAVRRRSRTGPHGGVGPTTGITDAVIQLQNYQDGRLDALATAGFSLAVIDLARDAGSSYFTTDEITQLKGAGTKVLAYFEIGSIENFRPDFATLKEHDGHLFLNEWPSWPGEYFVRYWDHRWWSWTIKPRIDRALAAGFDGVYLDTPLAYWELDLGLVPGEQRDSLARKMVDLIARISRYGKAAKPGFLVFPNNSPELRRYPGYTEAIDGIGMESMFFKPTDIPCTEPYCATNLNEARELRKAGKIVLAIDYANKPENIATAYRRYREEHFIGYVGVRELNTIRPACPE